MSKFTTPAILEMLDDYRWRLVEPFEFWLTDNPDDVIYVPEGYVTDLASVPRLLWALFPPHGRYAKAAIIHDWLYDNVTDWYCLFTWSVKICNMAHVVAKKACHTDIWQANVCYGKTNECRV